ncbi:ABC transporter ATP-binding protein [Enterococcus hulanensis]|uniref:ABC transporter ATP-binding protein n=1 Tax=Enterococcus hulanensis TaxID=2559929 RepID=A0ABU3F418_9ENTE|nr:ABC transporter ATP-binding protein [Enterococcus hulanensis]MDT2601873.1 ABC transporter ATP-binding protein [Enterococcus hulanensis]MDT2611370.1 ABC transporter ATP-binding protein [Enterococcus hulanensis]MDT2618714.1 ABC transporter ATP-binding protein [Enterococcus hulanensis]MDT2629945.1 ABC transporter ATP-binding protein [Enterococcus hulanensis]MDT2657652.1 ABC transporter ATP-binding protein [Enterococcus hulanensis]
MITVKNLFYRYPKNKADTLRNISFEVKKGEIFGFLGPSGAGKSTLQKILTGTLPDYQGEVSVLDYSLNHLSNDYYNKIGVDFEFPNFYSKFTALENLNYFSSLYSQETLDPLPLLQRMDLQEDAQKPVARFSKGMKTRLGFIRCLLHDPDLLFLDEPTSGLDPTNARILKDIVKELKNAGKTIILTTHNMHDAEELCDRVAFIVDGEIRAMDTPAAFRHSSREKNVMYTFITQKNIEEERVIPLNTLYSDSHFRAMSDADKVTRVHSSEQSLEDIFISITGRQLL